MSLNFEGLEVSEEIQAKLIEQASGLTAGYVKQEEFDKVLHNRDELLGEKKTAQQKAKEAEEAAEKARLDAAASNGDVDALNASWQAKNDALQQELDTTKQGIKSGKISDIAQGFVNQNVVDDAFSRDAMKGEYAKRLDIREGKTVVLDAEGNLTALTVEDLNNEFLSASKFKSHLLASKADGGGAGGGQKGDKGGAGVPKTLAECKGDKALEAAYFNRNMGITPT